VAAVHLRARLRGCAAAVLVVLLAFIIPTTPRQWLGLGWMNSRMSLLWTSGVPSYAGRQIAQSKTL